MTEPVASYVIPRAGGGHSDYIVYVDESGDHSLTSIDPDYPVFVLSFCIFRKAEYAQAVTPVTIFLTSLRPSTCKPLGA